MKTIVVMILLLLQFCLNAQPEQLKGLHWLAGTWLKIDANPKNAVQMFEEWKIETNGLLTGKGYKVSGKDTIVNEMLNILPSVENKVTYVATVLNQNDSKPIHFQLINRTKTKYSFSNPKHDFPSLIEYNQPDKKGIMRVRLSGKLNGTEKKITYNFKKK